MSHNTTDGASPARRRGVVRALLRRHFGPDWTPMEQLPDLGPIDRLLRAAGYSPMIDPMLADVDFGGIIDIAIEDLGVLKEECEPFRICIHNAILKYRFRAPSTGNHIAARDIAKSLKLIEDSLESVDSALTMIHKARASIAGAGTKRGKSLEDVQHSILQEIGRAVFATFQASFPSPEQLARVMPSYEWLNFSNARPTPFASARHSIAALRRQYGASSFALTAHDKDPLFVVLIDDLARLFEEATNRKPTSPDPSPTQARDKRSLFSNFVATLWPLMGAFGDDEADIKRQRAAPSNKRIREALKLRTGL
jgi:hypothetical protein